jgi:hypothetical protein
MKGVQYFFDEAGEPKAVLIDVRKNPELWEDFRDFLTIRERSHEPTIPIEKVEKRLKELGKIK